MRDYFFTDADNNDVMSDNKAEGMQFTKPSENGEIEFIEYEVDRFDYEGYEVVRKEFFSKANCPAVTIKYGKVNFNVRAIRKLGESSHILILINFAQKRMIAKPCDEDDKDSLQWSRVDKNNKVVPRTISGKMFTAQLFKDMNWHLECTFKMLGTLLTCKGEKMFVFDLMNAERYLSISTPTEDNPKRRERVAFIPQLWEKSYGASYEESQKPIVETFEGLPEDYVKIVLPTMPHKKSLRSKDKGTWDLFSEQENTEKEQENGKKQR
jgi:hypothetical protein